MSGQYEIAYRELPRDLVEYTQAHLAKMMEISANVTTFDWKLPAIEPKKEEAP